MFIGRQRRAFALLFVGCALGALGALAGCAGLPEATTGRITGAVYQVGGPMGLYATAVPTIPQRATVTANVKDSSSGTRYRTGTASDGTFTLEVAPGVYDVSATLASGGEVRSVEVTVAKGETVTVELDSYVP